MAEKAAPGMFPVEPSDLIPGIVEYGRSLIPGIVEYGRGRV